MKQCSVSLDFGELYFFAPGGEAFHVATIPSAGTTYTLRVKETARPGPAKLGCEVRVNGAVVFPYYEWNPAPGSYASLRICFDGGTPVGACEMK